MNETWNRLGYFRRVADRIEEQPALIDRALVTADRWLANGIEPRARILQWRDLLEKSTADLSARETLLALLREDSEDAEFHREFAPVPGLLSNVERREFFRECAYSH